jgi:hypothetical protein
MKLVQCAKCGSNELVEENGFVICTYCRLKFIPDASDLPKSGAVISIYDDIRDLLEKCKIDPLNRKVYANLILDLDPNNIEAMKYLR